MKGGEEGGRLMKRFVFLFISEQRPHVCKAVASKSSQEHCTANTQEGTMHLTPLELTSPECGFQLGFHMFHNVWSGGFLVIWVEVPDVRTERRLV